MCVCWRVTGAATEIIADGADAVRAATRTMIREGVDTIKLNLSGDNWVKPGFSEVLTYSEAEIAAAAEEANEFGIKLACHSHGKRSIMMALKYGFYALYHCEYADEEALDAMEAKKDTFFVAPTVGLLLHLHLRSSSLGHYHRDRGQEMACW